MTNSQATQPAPRLAEQQEHVGGLFGRINASDSFFDTIKSTPESIKDYLEKCIKCLRIGKGTPPEIESAAFIVGQQMLAENLTFAEIRQKYHIYPDKLDHRSEWVHAEISRQGWKWKWKHSDDERAIFSASKDGETCDFEYTMDMAKKEQLVKKDSGYEKSPARQLRARAVTGWSTMYAPQIGAGTQVDTDVSGSVELDSSQVSASAVSHPLGIPAATSRVAPHLPPAAASIMDSAAAAGLNVVTVQSMASALDLPARAFTSFNFVTDDCEKITTIGDIVKHTYDQLLSRDKLGKGTLDKIVIELKRHGFDLLDPLAETPQSGDGLATDATSVQPEASTDEAALSARGLELAEDSDANHADNFHGQCIAEIRQICGKQGEEYEFAKMVMGERCGGKSSLNDLSVLEATTVLIHILGRKLGIPIERVDSAVAKVNAEPVPIDAAEQCLNELRAKLGN